MTKKSTGGQGRIGTKEFLFSLSLILIAWLLRSCLGVDLFGADPGYIMEPTSSGIQVVFTSPHYPDEPENRRGGLDEDLAAAIDEAQKSIAVAAFDFDLERVADALIRAHERSVRVQVVTDDENVDLDEVQLLERAGIPVVDDGRGAFMHNKFVVIDDHQVWTGSWNLTDNGTYRNNNNVLIINSQRLAQNYTTEFREMFEDKAFGASSPDNTPSPRVELDGVRVETYFESEGDVRPRIRELLGDAQSSIHFMAFAFTDDDIAQAMVRKMREGVVVQGVMEARNVGGTGSEFELLRKAGVDIWKDGNPYIMHHKTIIVDEAIVITGSYNFTASAAERNDENVLILHSPEIAAVYMQEYQRVYWQAREEQ